MKHAECKLVRVIQFPEEYFMPSAMNVEPYFDRECYLWSFFANAASFFSTDSSIHRASAVRRFVLRLFVCLSVYMSVSLFVVKATLFIKHRHVVLNPTEAHSH